MEAIQFISVQESQTAVPNIFLDRYMPRADGEFVKIYLLLWRYCTAGRGVSVAELADLMDDTEKDILRGIRYWEKQHLLSSTVNEQGEITAIRFLPVEPVQEAAASGRGMTAPAREMEASEREMAASGQRAVTQRAAVQRADSAKASAGRKKEEHAVRPATHKKLAVDEEFGQLVYIVGKYLNRTMRPTDCQILEYLYGELGMSAELLEYLVETCVDAGHASLHYIEKVALDWHSKGIRTVADAREQAELFRKQYYQILKAFGISRRGPAPDEKRVMDLWLYDYGFSMEVILEACSRTIRATHEPSFEYANGILSDWKRKGVKNSSDITVQDEAFQKKKESEKTAAKGTANGAANGAPPRNRFHNYEQSGYDYDQILADLNR